MEQVIISQFWKAVRKAIYKMDRPNILLPGLGMYTVNDVRLLAMLKHKGDKFVNVDKIKHLAQTKYEYRKSKTRKHAQKNIQK